jgi:pilus assembly protein CpaF
VNRNKEMDMTEDMNASAEGRQETTGANMLVKKENYGVLLPFIEDDNVTDINWNGEALWIDDLTKGRYRSDVVLDDAFVEQFGIRVSNVVSKAWNKYEPKLEAETEDLRITIVHNSVSHTGTAISIRKTPAVRRINFAKSIQEGTLCDEKTANFISNCVKAKCNIVVCGLPGSGKTELVKYLTNYIFPKDRVITIEDTAELHYNKINNGEKDCLEFKVDDNGVFTYVDAIKTSLRLLPEWIILSEARSTEVKYLLESLSTGAKCLTTIHTDDVRKIPDRIRNMMGTDGRGTNVEDQIYEFLDVALLVQRKETRSGDDVNIERYITQVAVFTADEDGNRCQVILDEGKWTGEKVQESFVHRLEVAGIGNPFAYTFIDG